MPKMKTNRSAAKRFKKTADGYRHRAAFRNHLLTKKSSKRKAQLAGGKQVDKSNLKAVRAMLIN